MVHLTGEVYLRAEGVLRRRSKAGPNAIYRVANPSRLGRRGGNHLALGELGAKCHLPITPASSTGQCNTF